MSIILYSVNDFAALFKACGSGRQSLTDTKRLVASLIAVSNYNQGAYRLRYPDAPETDFFILTEQAIYHANALPMDMERLITICSSFERNSLTTTNSEGLNIALRVIRYAIEEALSFRISIMEQSLKSALLYGEKCKVIAINCLKPGVGTVAGATTVSNIQPRSIKRHGTAIQPAVAGVFHADITADSIRIYGTHGTSKRSPFDRTFKLGDLAEHDSYNLVYTGLITAISAKRITINDDGKIHCMQLHDFINRNWDFDAIATGKRNAVTMQCI